MDNEIRLLAGARAGCEELKAELAEVEEELSKNPLAVLQAQLKKRIVDMKRVCYDLETRIRQDALDSYGKTGHKLPHPAVSVGPDASILDAWYDPMTPVYIKNNLSAYLNREESSETADPHTT